MASLPSYLKGFIMDLIIGIVIGTAFAPFWVWLYNTQIKPRVLALIAKIQEPHPPVPPADGM